MYDAFISYSHAKDKPIASALQSRIQSLGKPWYRRRALRLFRDDTSLSATPALWPSIQEALSQSRFLLVLASPQFAASRWCQLELAYWLEHKSADTILVALTEGELDWLGSEFRWDRATPLPACLKGSFEHEPKWIDLRQFRAGASRRDRRLTELAANFAATIHGRPKEDLLSEEVRQQRRAIRTAGVAIMLLIGLLGAAARQYFEAERQRQVAVSNLRFSNDAVRRFAILLIQSTQGTDKQPLDDITFVTIQDLVSTVATRSPNDIGLKFARVMILIEVVAWHLRAAAGVGIESHVQEADEAASQALALARDLAALPAQQQLEVDGSIAIILADALNAFATMRAKRHDHEAASAAWDESLSILRTINQALAGSHIDLWRAIRITTAAAAHRWTVREESEALRLWDRIEEDFQELCA
jgi:hypothetical protein